LISKLSNSELLVRIAREDKRAFDELFKRLNSRLIRFSLLYVKSYENAEDIVSDVFYQFLKNRKKADKIENVEKYFYKAVKLHSFKFLRKRINQTINLQLEQEADYFNTNESPERSYLNDELEKLIYNAVEKLPPKRKAIFKMIKEDGLKYQDAAEVMDVSVKTIETHLALAIKDLKQTILEYYQYQSNTDSKKINLPLNSLLLLISTLI